jgi:hypothetical protein
MAFGNNAILEYLVQVLMSLLSGIGPPLTDDDLAAGAQQLRRSIHAQNWRTVVAPE